MPAVKRLDAVLYCAGYLSLCCGCPAGANCVVKDPVPDNLLRRRHLQLCTQPGVPRSELEAKALLELFGRMCKSSIDAA